LYKFFEEMENFKDDGSKLKAVGEFPVRVSVKFKKMDQTYTLHLEVQLWRVDGPKRGGLGTRIRTQENQRFQRSEYSLVYRR
jgi:hypothetical protein